MKLVRLAVTIVLLALRNLLLVKPLVICVLLAAPTTKLNKLYAWVVLVVFIKIRMVQLLALLVLQVRHNSMAALHFVTIARLVITMTRQDSNHAFLVVRAHFQT